MKTLAPLKGSRKIFGIGYNKTGTTTLARIPETSGFRLANQVEQELLLTDNMISGDYSGFKEFAHRYDAFQDMPFSQGLTFVACDALMPGSKFILTV